MTETASKCATMLHIIAFSIYSYVSYYSIYHLNLPISDAKYAYAGKWKFLTVWNITLCLAYFGLCLALNVLRLRFLTRLRDFIFCSVSLPSCIFITCSFWGLYAYDRELILPRRVEPFYPKWLNHSQHTLITVTAVLEALLRRHKVPSKIVGFFGMLTWFAIYQVWVLYLGNAKGVWVYPVMQVLSAAQLAAFSIANSVVLFLLYLGCHAFLRWRNRKSGNNTDTELKKAI